MTMPVGHTALMEWRLSENGQSRGIASRRRAHEREHRSQGNFVVDFSEWRSWGCWALFVSPAGAVEPEKQPIYSNIIGGLLCGTSSTNQCKVPAGRRLIIEYVSGYVFAPLSANQTTVVTMAITDQQLGLNGNGFHVFPATKVNTTVTEDVFAFFSAFEDDAASKGHFLFL